MTANQFRRLYLAVAVLSIFAGTAFAQCTNFAIPGKFYEYYIIAQTGSCNGNNFTSLGSNPSINDFGQVGFMAQSSALSGTALWVGDGHNHPATTPINPNETGSSEIYDGAVQVGSGLGNTQLVSKDSITTTTPATTSIRIWNTATADSGRYVARGGPRQAFSAVLPYPSIDIHGDAALVALDATNPSLHYLVEVTAAGVQSKVGVNVSVGEPMLDDNGDVLLYQQSSASNYEITLYASGLAGTPTIIADQTNFSSIDSAPGISHDGMVVAFQGNLSAAGASNMQTYAGPGIFAATNEGGGVWHITRITNIMVEKPNSGGNGDGICNFGEACVPAAELGFDDNGNPIYFNPTGYAAGTRVAVMNLGLGATGIDDDSFVISFIGTPTSASRLNPVLKNGTPLFFSASQGLWTIRVDVQHDLSPPNNRVYHPRTAITVAQINDKIAGNVITALGAYDDLANAARDETGNLRTMRRGDHRVAFWTSFAGGQMIVRANHLDSDQDGLLDHWETTGIDMDQDGVVDLNLPAMGANPFKRDLFLEFAWIADQPGATFSFQPAPGVVSAANGSGQTNSALVAMFAAAPSLAGNEYGLRADGANPAAISAGITLHIDGGGGNDKQNHPFSINMGTGNLEGGGNIGLTGSSAAGLPEVIYFGKPGSLTIPDIETRSYQDIKDNYFGTMDKDSRELAFHYVVFGEFYSAWPDNNNAYSWQISSATADTLTSASNLPPMPQDTNTGIVGQGQVVKITGGAGAGQYNLIYQALNTNTVQLYYDWTTTPDDTSTFTVLDGSTGLAEVLFAYQPDFNSLPGNDQVVTMGGYRPQPGGINNGLLATGCAQWRTVAHELGHTLGLRHGGIDQNAFKAGNYLSLMSYSWQLQCKTKSQVQSYAGATDKTFNDWGSLQHNFSDSEIHLGNTLAIAFGTIPEITQTIPEQNSADYLTQNGPLDTTPPAVSITSPKNNANVGLTLPLTVTVDATDDTTVQSVSVSFDVSGSGTPQTVVAKPGGANTYKATFPALSGAPGQRTLSASAMDTSFNSATTSINVNVEAPNPVPSLTALSPSSATHGGKAFTLTITGSNLVSGCTAKWNGAALKTTFVNAGEVTATVPATDIATAGTASVTVVNPAPGGGTSNALTFTIN